jgi:hypothetical protein
VAVEDKKRLEQEQMFVKYQLKLIKYIEKGEDDKFISACKKLEKFQVFKLRFTFNPANGYSLIHMASMYECYDILKFLVEYFKQCYRQLLTQQNVDVQNGVAPGNILSKDQVE